MFKSDKTLSWWVKKSSQLLGTNDLACQIGTVLHGEPQILDMGIKSCQTAQSTKQQTAMWNWVLRLPWYWCSRTKCGKFTFMLDSNS